MLGVEPPQYLTSYAAFAGCGSPLQPIARRDCRRGARCKPRPNRSSIFLRSSAAAIPAPELLTPRPPTGVRPRPEL
eukprot:353169-Chlamydomonas_euryale.AAC.6